MEAIRRTVWTNKANGQKLITVPRDANIQDGDLVDIKRVKVVQECQVCGTEDESEKTKIDACPACLKKIRESRP